MQVVLLSCMSMIECPHQHVLQLSCENKHEGRLLGYCQTAVLNRVRVKTIQVECVGCSHANFHVLSDKSML